MQYVIDIDSITPLQPELLRRIIQDRVNGLASTHRGKVTVVPITGRMHRRIVTALLLAHRGDDQNAR